MESQNFWVDVYASLSTERIYQEEGTEQAEITELDFPLYNNG